MKRIFISVLILVIAVCFVSCVSQTARINMEISQLETETKEIEKVLKSKYRHAGLASKVLDECVEMRLKVKQLKARIESLKRKNTPKDVFEVTRVIDGDTIVLENGEKVRLIGVNCLPIKDGAELTEVMKEINLVGIEKESEMRDFLISHGITTSTFTALLCKEKEVRLECDKTKRDRYGHLLAYVWLPDGELLNEEIILQGHGLYYDKYPFNQEMMEKFKEAEEKRMIGVRTLLEFLEEIRPHLEPPTENIKHSGDEFNLGIVQYYEVTPHIPSGATNRNDYYFEPYVAIWNWSVLQTKEERGPRFVPTRVILGGKEYRISNVKTLNKAYKYYYIFTIEGQNPIKDLPFDVTTGNLIATEPEKRNRLPIRIEFLRTTDNKKWTGVGKIEQSTVLVMNAMMKKIEDKQ